MKRTVELGTVVFSLLLWSCGGDSTPTAPTPTPTPVATSITLSVTSLSLASLGVTSQLSATVKDQNGATMSGATVTWTTSDAVVATVSSTGLVTSVANGTATITATSGPASATASVTVATATVWASISAGDYHTVGLTTSGEAYAWGSNYSGQLGDPTAAGQVQTPVLVSGGHTWASISGGHRHTVGITTSGVAYAWGHNDWGQLGDGTTTEQSTPTPVIGGHTWASISAGGNHTMGITTSGDAYVWGRNHWGQLGDGTTTNRSTPTLVSGAWASIAAGSIHTAVLTTSGAAYAWGFNAMGQLGDGRTTDRSSHSETPTPVIGGHTWASISAGGGQTVGITTSGAAYAWGLNAYGQLGDGTTSGSVTGTEQSTPTLVIGGHTWASISGGYYHTVGLTTSGVAYAWGENGYGQLGDGTITDRTTPVLVGPHP